MLFLYVFATYAVSVAMIIFIHVIMDSNGQDTGLFDLDGRGFLLLMFISPIVCGVLFCMFFLRAIYHCLTYFTVNSRHKRKVKALKQEQERERELWEAKTGIKYEEIDSILDSGQDWALEDHKEVYDKTTYKN